MSSSSTMLSDRHLALRSDMHLMLQSKHKWSSYRFFCQFRFAYTAFLVMITVVMFSFTFLMELFFSVFLPSAQSDPHFLIRCVTLLVLLPFAILVLSYVFQESLNLFQDSLDSAEGSLPRFRLTLAIVIHYLRHKDEMPDLASKIETSTTSTKVGVVQPISTNETTPHHPSVDFGSSIYLGPPIDYSTFVVVDCICPLVFEIVTIVAFLVRLALSLSFVDALADYVRFAFYTVSLYLVLWMGTHYWCAYNHQMTQLIANYRDARLKLNQQVEAMVHEETFKSFWVTELGFRLSHTIHRFLADNLPRAAVCECRKLSKIHVTDAAIVDRARQWEREKAAQCCGMWHRLSTLRRLAALVPMLVLSALLSFYYFFVGWPLLGIFLMLTADILHLRRPQVYGPAFRFFVKSFICLSFVFFASALIIGTFVTGGSLKVSPPRPGYTSRGARTDLWGQSVYPICQFNLSGLSILDYALLADAAYGNTPALQLSMLHSRFGGTSVGSWNLSHVSDANTDHQKWFRIDFVDLNATVVAIRGTASIADALEDMHFWFGITIMQLANTLVPFLTQLPEDFVVNLLAMNFLEDVMPRPVFTPVLEYVQSLRDAGVNVVVTGHSLGGAVAAMLGARTKTPAVSFSGPGLVYSRARFHVTPADIRDYVATIKPSTDVVPMVDVLGGLVQDIECRKTNPLQCHSLTTTTCELVMACGDARHRDWSKATQCNEYIYI
ncbi:Aste57867_9984 [Aphanomyces stellatus]|uniref:Aste57867_9984 protein n=1 Tax=Aphanomyces stellatus TaxID=120398 RepID=A0A485KP78_9STRA|nr:hypothetical protein As57867_009945 [Aphanomyces stellatus]VFT86862.1 Aste57867_9984 [Aphanomyces stellatus]